MIIFRTFPACDFPPDKVWGPFPPGKVQACWRLSRHAELQVPSLARRGGGQSPRGWAEGNASAAGTVPQGIGMWIGDHRFLSGTSVTGMGWP